MRSGVLTSIRSRH